MKRRIAAGEESGQADNSGLPAVVVAPMLLLLIIFSFAGGFSHLRGADAAEQGVAAQALFILAPGG